MHIRVQRRPSVRRRRLRYLCSDELSPVKTKTSFFCSSGPVILMFANGTAQVMAMNANADEKLYSSGVLLGS